MFNISEVKLGIVEATGSLSVLKQDTNNNRDSTMNNVSSDNIADIAYPVIVEGKVYHESMKYVNVNMNMEWLMIQLKKKGIHNASSVFFLAL